MNNIQRIFLFVGFCIMFAAAALAIMFMVNGPFREAGIHLVVIIVIAAITIIASWKISGIDPDNTSSGSLARE